MPKQLAFYYDQSACTGCKTCQVVCKDKNDLPVGMSWRRVFHYGGGSWSSHPARKDLMVANGVFVYPLSRACMHCEKAACVEVCPTGAMAKRADGVVLVDQSRCIGCRYCQWACPYGAPIYDERKGVMTKCTFCEDLLAKGQNPACVDACPMRALQFGELDELHSKHGNVNAIEPLPVADITSPSLVISPHKRAQVSGKGTGRILDTEDM